MFPELSGTKDDQGVKSLPDSFGHLFARPPPPLCKVRIVDSRGKAIKTKTG